MKSFDVKFILLNALTLILGLGLMVGSISRRDAEAAKLDTIPAIQLNSLGNFKGQYLTALYAIGSRSFISTNSSQININQIKEVRQFQITDDSILLNSLQVEKEGFRPSYNMIVFVISPLPQFSWINADGSFPQGQGPTNNQLSSLVKSVNKTDIESFIVTQGESATMQINLVN